MRSLAAFAFIAAVAVASPAAAQFGWGQPFDRRDVQWVEPGAMSPDWRACSNENYEFSLDEIAAGCERVIENTTSHETRATALWWRASAFERAGQTDRSAADYEAALVEFDEWERVEEGPVEVHFKRASMLIAMREYDRALLDLDIADEMRRRQPRIHGSLGRIAFLRGDYATAIAQFDQAERLARRHNVGLMGHNRCEARAAAGVELELARTICDRAVRESQNHPTALVSRGYFRFRQGDMAGALADFENALDRDPNNAAALYGRATVAARSGQQEAAAADLARSLELNPRMAEYYGNAGMRP